jgi:hypothetical protein
MRLKDWESRLAKVVEDHRALPFDWATNNCSHFAGACVEAVSGTNPVAQLTGSYQDEAGAMAAIRAAGGGDIEDAVAKLFPKIAPGMARRGDIGIALSDGKKVLFVVLGQFAGAPGPRCLGWISRTKLISAFKVD